VLEFYWEVQYSLVGTDLQFFRLILEYKLSSLTSYDPANVQDKPVKVWQNPFSEMIMIKFMMMIMNTVYHCFMLGIYNCTPDTKHVSTVYTIAAIIQGDSLTSDPKLLSVKYYVIEIKTWKFIYTYRERRKTGPAYNRCWKWSPFTSKHTWMRFYKFWITISKVSKLTASLSWWYVFLLCSCFFVIVLLGERKWSFFCDGLITHKDTWQSEGNALCNFKLTNRCSHFYPRRKYFLK
jgi:hypothetical protein